MRNRNIHIQVWLNRTESQKLDRDVKKSGLSREGYIRHLINDYTPRESPPLDYFRLIKKLHRIGNNLNQIAAKAHTLNALDVQRYDRTVKMLENTIQKITDCMICPEKR